jgi:hypothetical protein
VKERGEKVGVKECESEMNVCVGEGERDGKAKERERMNKIE